MTVKTVKSDTARSQFRNLLDDAFTGIAETVIERNGKPAAVVVNYQQWQTWKAQRRATLDQLSNEVKAGNYVTQEQVDAGLRERGLIE